MAQNDHPISGALTRAAERWQRAFLVGGRAPLPKLAELAAQRGPEEHPGRAVPSPFRPRPA